jgi:soluble lytic murein transglycosylase-like protein
MERLRFGRGARRRARLRRAVLAAWIATLAGSALGMPTGIDALGSLATPVGGGAPAAGVEASEAIVSLVRFRREAIEAAPEPRRRPARERRRPQEPADERAPEGSIEDIVYEAAAEHGVEGSYLLTVAWCESDLDPNASSPVGYRGLFQFDEETWATYGYGSIYDPVAQARTAARLIAAGHAHRWPNCA